MASMSRCTHPCARASRLQPTGAGLTCLPSCASPRRPSPWPPPPWHPAWPFLSLRPPLGAHRATPEQPAPPCCLPAAARITGCHTRVKKRAEHVCVPILRMPLVFVSLSTWVWHTHEQKDFYGCYQYILYPRLTSTHSHIHTQNTER